MKKNYYFWNTPNKKNFLPETIFEVDDWSKSSSLKLQIKFKSYAMKNE